MHMHKKVINQLLSVVFLTSLCGIYFSFVFPVHGQENKIPAFPGAEGFGAFATGGRGGEVYLVTTLEDYHPGQGPRDAVIRINTGETILPALSAIVRQKPISGSLRAAIEAEGPRIVIFQISGTIVLKAPLRIENPNITIAGQTAPGDGICLKNYGIQIWDTHEVVIRYLRVRPGDLTRESIDAINISRSENVIIDHCSTSWGIDENLSVSAAKTSNVTVQWCIISESLHESWHRKGPHGMGSLIRTDGDVTFHHNLYAHNNARNPRPGTYGDPPGLRLDFRNNVIYNWGDISGYSAEDPATINYIGNYIKPGPSVKRRRDIAFYIGGESTKIYSEANILENDGNCSFDNWAMIARANPINKLSSPFIVNNIKTEPTKEAYKRVLTQSGASLPTRDNIDERIIKDVMQSTGAIIDSQKDVGGWPSLFSDKPPMDSDKDGMPDAWEIEKKLNPNVPIDKNDDYDGDGYSNLEEYLNDLCNDLQTRKYIKKLR
jgi:pectate lyase